MSLKDPDRATPGADPRSDVRVLGGLLDEMFERDGSRERKPLAGVPPDLERVVARCLRADPEGRFQTMADLEVALEDLRREWDSGQLGAIGRARSDAAHATRVRFRSDGVGSLPRRKIRSLRFKAMVRETLALLHQLLDDSKQVRARLPTALSPRVMKLEKAIRASLHPSEPYNDVPGRDPHSR